MRVQVFLPSKARTVFQGDRLCHLNNVLLGGIKWRLHKKLGKGDGRIKFRVKQFGVTLKPHYVAPALRGATLLINRETPLNNLVPRIL